jgi:hypothetical protein
MSNAIFTGTMMVLFCSMPATPAGLPPVPLRHAAPLPSPAREHRIAAAALYSRRSRRLVQSYLRLKLLEMRERDLDRARRVVERKLGINGLLGETPSPVAR